MGTISNLVTADHREGEADSTETELLFHCYKYLDCDSCDVSLHEKSVAVSAWVLLLALSRPGPSPDAALSSGLPGSPWLSLALQTDGLSSPQ